MFEDTGTVEQSHESATETTQQNTSIFDELDEQEQSSPEQAVEETETVEAESVEGETEGEDANWLPTEQLKVFPQEVIAKYAKRFGYTPEEIAADPRLANALSKMINSDIHIEAQKKAEEEAAAQAEDEPEAVEAAEPTPEEAAALQTQRDSLPSLSTRSPTRQQPSSSRKDSPLPMRSKIQNSEQSLLQKL